MAPSTPPPPSKLEFAALTIALTSWRVMSPTTTRTRPPRNDSVFESLTARLSSDLVEHVVATQCLCYSFGLVLGQGVFRLGARDLEKAIVEHHDSERAECHARNDLHLVHIVKAKATCLFNPILDERIAQSVFGFRFGEIRAFDDETIFPHFFGLLSGQFSGQNAAGRLSGTG